MNGIQEVSGSIPLISTKQNSRLKGWLFLLGADRFGEDRRSNTSRSFAKRKRRAGDGSPQAGNGAVSRRGEASEYPAYLHHTKR